MTVSTRKIPTIMLPQERVQALSIKDPSNPYLRRHLAASQAIRTFLQTSPLSPNSISSYAQHKVPRVLKLDVLRLNRDYLKLPTDMHLAPIHVWKIIFNSQLQTSRDDASAHRCIYVQQRHSTPEEIDLGRQKRKKPITKNMIDQSSSSLSHNTTIIQSGADSLIYQHPNLHANHHGSAAIGDLRNKLFLLDFLGISHKEIDIQSSGKRGIVSHLDMAVAYPHSWIMKRINKKLSCGGVQRFHQQLARHLYAGGEHDTVRMEKRSISTNPPRTTAVGSATLVFSHPREQTTTGNFTESHSQVPMSNHSSKWNHLSNPN